MVKMFLSDDAPVTSNLSSTIFAHENEATVGLLRPDQRRAGFGYIPVKALVRHEGTIIKPRILSAWSADIKRELVAEF